VAPTDVSSQVELAARLREGELSVAPQVVNLLESSAAADRERAKALLGELSPRALGREPAGQIVGVTGPPGAGKSTLLAALIAELRRRGERGVAVLAVDPSSRLSGGSLLGDRLRIALPNPDPAVFIRSLAAGGRHGGLARGVRESAEALAVAFPWVVIETVGVGQGETEVAEVADTVCLVVQPASGDTLQFLKAGIMEVPDLFVVTKADLREQARRTTLELQAALKTLGRGEIPVVGVRSLPPPQGVDRLADELVKRRELLLADGGRALAERRLAGRRLGALTTFLRDHGELGMRELGGRRAAQRLLERCDPAASIAELVGALEREAGAGDRGGGS